MLRIEQVIKDIQKAGIISNYEAIAIAAAVFIVYEEEDWHKANFIEKYGTAGYQSLCSLNKEI